MSTELSVLVASQQAFFHSGKTRSSDFRVASLERLRSALIQETSALEAAMRDDLGKPESEFVTGELGFVLSELKRAIRSAPRSLRSKRVSTPLFLLPGKSEIERDPYGPVLVIGPWNAPLQLLMVPAIAALVSGNTVVLKPSECAPHTASVVERLVNRHFDSDYFHVVLGDSSVAAQLSSQQFSYVFFTGSESAGREVYLAAAKNLCPVTLELGGRNPCVVRPDANLRVAARRIVFGKFFNAGQTCIAPNVVFVPEASRAELIQGLRQAIEDFFGAEPHESPNYGRIINRQHFARLLKLLQGSEVCIGGQTDATERYIAPTVVHDMAEDSALTNDEIFGPILPVVGYATEEELRLSLARYRTPLALYVFTEDYRAAREIGRHVVAGALVVNDTISQTMNPNLPFGGVGTSGLGSYRGEESWRTFTRPKAVLSRSTRLDLDFRYPPYAPQALSAMRRAVASR